MTEERELADELERLMGAEKAALNDITAKSHAPLQRAYAVRTNWIDSNLDAILTALRTPSNTREDALEEAAKKCAAKAERARSNTMFPAYCLNAVADTADELAEAIRALKLNPTNPIPGQSGEKPHTIKCWEHEIREPECPKCRSEGHP